MFNEKSYASEYRRLNRDYFNQMYRYKRYGEERPVPKAKPKKQQYTKEFKLTTITFD